jgi:hypothetical protein
MGPRFQCREIAIVEMDQPASAIIRIKSPSSLFLVIEKREHARGWKERGKGSAQLRQIDLAKEGVRRALVQRPDEVLGQPGNASQLGKGRRRRRTQVRGGFGQVGITLP